MRESGREGSKGEWERGREGENEYNTQYIHMYNVVA